MLPVELLLQNSVDGVFQSWVSATFRIIEQKFILIISAANPRHCSCTSWQEDSTVPSHLTGEEGWGNEGFSHAMVVHSILRAMRRSTRKRSLAILNSKTASSRGMYPQIISAVPWHLYWGLVIQPGSKSCRTWVVACLWSLLVGWLHPVLAQNQNLSALCKTALRSLSELYCLLTKTKDKAAR